nr:MAG TPA: hypothetical protein [Caudoviricetes sp.]
MTMSLRERPERERNLLHYLLHYLRFSAFFTVFSDDSGRKIKEKGRKN